MTTPRFDAQTNRGFKTLQWLQSAGT